MWWAVGVRGLVRCGGRVGAVGSRAPVAWADHPDLLHVGDVVDLRRVLCHLVQPCEAFAPLRRDGRLRPGGGRLALGLVDEGGEVLDVEFGGAGVLAGVGTEGEEEGELGQQHRYWRQEADKPSERARCAAYRC